MNDRLRKIVNEDKKSLAKQLAKYVGIIKNDFYQTIPSDILKYLETIEDFKNVVGIEQTGTISMFMQGGIIYFPLNAYKIINLMKKVPGFGSRKQHKTYQPGTLISNSNNYSDYIKHVFFAGLTPLQYFQESLLHETMHLCGSGGGSGLREGFNELKTRELAAKHDLSTSACGYPKEVKIALALQDIFGKEVCDKITFAKNSDEIYSILNSTFGQTEAELYSDVAQEVEFQHVLYSRKNYGGLFGPLRKTKQYNKINYDKVYQLIDEYLSIIQA